LHICVASIGCIAVHCVKQPTFLLCCCVLYIALPGRPRKQQQQQQQQQQQPGPVDELSWHMLLASITMNNS
jgi:hypothetical protein